MIIATYLSYRYHQCWNNKQNCLHFSSIFLRFEPAQLNPWSQTYLALDGRASIHLSKASLNEEWCVVAYRGTCVYIMVQVDEKRWFGDLLPRWWKQIVNVRGVLQDALLLPSDKRSLSSCRFLLGLWSHESTALTHSGTCIFPITLEELNQSLQTLVKPTGWLCNHGNSPPLALKHVCLALMTNASDEVWRKRLHFFCWIMAKLYEPLIYTANTEICWTCILFLSPLQVQEELPLKLTSFKGSFEKTLGQYGVNAIQNCSNTAE